MTASATQAPAKVPENAYGEAEMPVHQDVSVQQGTKLKDTAQPKMANTHAAVGMRGLPVGTAQDESLPFYDTVQHKLETFLTAVVQDFGLKLLDPISIAPRLHIDGIITDDEHEKVLQLPTRDERKIDLYQCILPTKSPEKVISALREISVEDDIARLKEIIEHFWDVPYAMGKHDFLPPEVSDFQGAVRYLKAVYGGSDCEIMRKQWMAVSNFPFPEDFRFTNMYINPNFLSRESSLKESCIQNYQDLFGTSGQQVFRKIILEGGPAMGKTTYVHKIARDWATNNDEWLNTAFKLVLLFPLDGIQEGDTITDALKRQLPPNEAEVIWKFILCSDNHAHILFILDGFDEFKDHKKSSEFSELITHQSIRGHIMRNCTVLLTTRIGQKKHIKDADRSLVILGLPLSTAEKSLTEHCKADARQCLSVSIREPAIQHHSVLYLSPLLAGVAHSLLTTCEKDVPVEVFDLTAALIKQLINRHLILKLHQHHDGFRKIWKQLKSYLSAVAFYRKVAMMKEAVATEGMLDHFRVKFSLSALNHKVRKWKESELYKLSSEIGLLQENEIDSETMENCFSHRLFLEYFAAVYATKHRHALRIVKEETLVNSLLTYFVSGLSKEGKKAEKPKELEITIQLLPAEIISSNGLDCHCFWTYHQHKLLDFVGDQFERIEQFVGNHQPGDRHCLMQIITRLLHSGIKGSSAVITLSSLNVDSFSSKLTALFPQCNELHLHDCIIQDLAPLELSQIETLVIESCRISTEGLRNLAMCCSDKLHQLHLNALESNWDDLAGLKIPSSIKEVKLSGIAANNIPVIMGLLSGFHQTSIEAVDVSNSCCLTPDIVKAIPGTIKKLNISKCSLNEDAVSALVSFFCRVEHLCSLDLSQNNELSANSWIDIFNVAPPEIQQLKVCNCSLTNQISPAIVHFLSAVRDMHEFNLSKNPDLSFHTWNSIFQVLPTSIQKLKLKHCKLPGSTLATFLASADNLLELDLEHCGEIPAQSWNSIFEVMPASIVSLNIANCNLDDITMVAVSSFLKMSGKLQHLKIRGNEKVSAQLWKKIFQDLPCTIQTLDIKSTIAQLVSSTQSHETLKNDSLILSSAVQPTEAENASDTDTAYSSGLLRGPLMLSSHLRDGFDFKQFASSLKDMYKNQFVQQSSPLLKHVIFVDQATCKEGKFSDFEQTILETATSYGLTVLSDQDNVTASITAQALCLKWAEEEETVGHEIGERKGIKNMDLILYANGTVPDIEHHKADNVWEIALKCLGYEGDLHQFESAVLDMLNWKHVLIILDQFNNPGEEFASRWKFKCDALETFLSTKEATLFVPILITNPHDTKVSFENAQSHIIVQSKPFQCRFCHLWFSSRDQMISHNIDDHDQHHLTQLYDSYHAATQVSTDSKDSLIPKAIQYLKHVYINDCEIMKEHWSKLLMDYPEEFEMDEMYIDLELVKENRRSKEKVCSYPELFGVKYGTRNIRKIILEGDPGMGKSTYVHRLVLAWASGWDEWLNNEFDLVVLVRLGDLAPEQTLYDILLMNLPNEMCNSVMNFMHDGRNHRRILMVLDAFDEMTTNSWFEKLIHDHTVGVVPAKNITVLITTRISHANCEPLRYRDFTVRTLGFNPDVVKNRFAHSIPNMGALTENLSQEMLRNPFFVGIVACLGYIPDELFDLINEFSKKFVKRYVAVKPHHKKIAEDQIWNQVKNYLGKKALSCLDLTHYIQVNDAVEELQKECQEFIAHSSQDILKLCCEVGLLWPKKAKFLPSIMNYVPITTFPHKLLAEFFAASGAAELGLAETLADQQIKPDAKQTAFSYFFTGFSPDWKTNVVKRHIIKSELHCPWIYNSNFLPNVMFQGEDMLLNKIDGHFVPNGRMFLQSAITKYGLRPNFNFKLKNLTFGKDIVELLNKASHIEKLAIQLCQSDIQDYAASLWLPHLRDIEIDDINDEHLLWQVGKLIEVGKLNDRGLATFELSNSTVKEASLPLFSRLPTSLQVLKIRNSQFCLSALNDLCEFIRMSTITELHLVQTDLGSQPQFCAALPITLTTLKLQDFMLSTEAAFVLSQYLMRTSALQILDVSGNKEIGGLPQFFASLPRTLTTLKIRNCHLTAESICSLSQYLMVASLLEILDVSGNETIGMHPEFFADLPKTLTVLQTMDCHLTEESVQPAPLYTV